MIKEIFGNLTNTFNEKKFLYEHAILTPQNKHVDLINKIVMQQCPGDTEVTCVSADSVGPDDSESDYPIGCLNSLCPTGIPPHELELKAGAIIKLMRNLKGHVGTCNGAKSL